MLSIFLVMWDWPIGWYFSKICYNSSPASTSRHYTSGFFGILNLADLNGSYWFMVCFSHLDHSGWWSWSSKSATGPIKFYNRDDPYYEFTNFYSAPIEVDRKTWPTTEHYFQAQKFVGTPYEEQIRHLSRPRQAFDFTRDPKVSRWRRNDWESIKEDVMYKALLAKFTQHDYLRKMLLGTGERKLVEHSPYDSYWGDGGDGTGRNRLGELLMRLRRELRSGRNIKKGATHNQQEVTSEQFQHSSPQSGQGWEQSDNTPHSSARENCNYQASHSCLLREHLHPTNSAYQLGSSGDSVTSKDPLHQQGSTMHMPGSVPCYLNAPATAPNTAQPSFDDSQQPPHQLPSNAPGTVFDGSQPSTSKVDPSSYQQVPWHLHVATPANGQHNQMDQQRRDEKMDFTEAGMIICYTPFNSGNL